MDDKLGFWEAIKPLIHNPVAYVIIGLMVLFVIYMIFIKKDKRFKAVVTKIIKDMIKDSYKKGIEIDIIVDDVIAKAIKKIKAEPDPWDGLLCYILQAKWFRNKVVQIVKDKIEEIVQSDTDEKVIKVETSAKK